MQPCRRQERRRKGSQWTNASQRETAQQELSPYRHFTRAEWAALRADTPLTLTVDDLAKLQSINDPISVEEVIAIYLPLSRLLALYVAATQGLFKATQRFLGAEDGKVPYHHRRSPDRWRSANRRRRAS